MSKNSKQATELPQTVKHFEENAFSAKEDISTTANMEDGISHVRFTDVRQNMYGYLMLITD